MANRLKIYACSGIGQTEQGTWNYWLDNTETVNNTQAVNTLLALINRNYIEVTRLRGMSDADKIANLNDIDVYVLCLHAAQKLNRTWKQLENAGYVINSMLERGDFNCDSLDNTERDAHLDLLFEKFEQGINEDMQAAESDFMIWYRQNVIERNKVGLNKQSRERVNSALRRSTNNNQAWQENADLSKYLNDAATYFLYTYFTNSQLSKLPVVFRVKKQKQINIYNYCKSLFVDIYGSEEQMKEIIRTGIIQKFTVTPEDVCKDIVNGKRTIDGVGALGAAEIAAIITAVCTLLGILIKGICDVIAKKNEDKYGSVDQAAINAATPDPSDFDGLNIDPSPSPSGMSKWLLWAAAGIGVLLIFKNSKKA